VRISWECRSDRGPHSIFRVGRDFRWSRSFLCFPGTSECRIPPRMHARILRVLLAIALVVSSPLLPIPAGAVVSAQQDPNKVTVYITKTGEKYHKDGCSSLRKSRFPVTLREAVTRGFGACKNCRPPTILQATSKAPTPKK
jgi:hypothetical protein